jgi:diguanylate cyclase (GGDEF)-like protein
MVLPAALLPRLVFAAGIATVGIVALLAALLYRSRRGFSLYAALAFGIAFHIARPVVRFRPTAAIDPLGHLDGALAFLLPLFAWAFLHAFLRLPLSPLRRTFPAIPFVLGIVALLSPALLPYPSALAAVALLGLAADFLVALVRDRRRPALSTALVFFGTGSLLLGVLLDVAMTRETLTFRSSVPFLGAGFLLFSLVLLVVMADEDRRLFVRATTDALTGLANRATFLERARFEIHRVERTGRPLAVVLLDIDRFKAVNDRHGHPAGDRVLSGAAQAIARTVRGIDLAARWGGEEFAVLLVEADESTAGSAVERIREAVASLEPPRVPARVTVSAGIAVHHGLFERARVEGLIRRADEALYEAKRKGRDRAEFEKSLAVAPTTPADVKLR